MNSDQNAYNIFYTNKDWSYKYGELKWQIKAYLKYISLERSIAVSTILDVGCGTGDHCAIFDSMGYKTVGIDFAQSAIEKAKKKYPHIEFHESDALQFEPSQKFDLFFVSGFSVFNTEELSKPEKVITNWVSKLERHGSILILSRTDLSGSKSSGGWFYHTEEQIRNMYRHQNFKTILYYAHPKLRYLILIPIFHRFWAKIVHVLSKYILARLFKVPIRYMVIMTRNS